MRRTLAALATFLLAVAAAIATPSGALAVPAPPVPAVVPAPVAATAGAAAAENCRTYVVDGYRWFGECTGLDPRRTWRLQLYCAWRINGRVYDYYADSSVIAGDATTELSCSPGKAVEVRILLGDLLPPEPAGPVGAITGLAGKCVTVRDNRHEDGTPVELFDCNGGYGQSWRVGTDGTVRSLGKCLDVAGGGTGNGNGVQLYVCNGTGAQQWQVRPGGLIVNPQSGRCLDVPRADASNGNRLIIWDCAGGVNQVWRLPA
ncbi:ricin-type beta-trefoil lectin domain protein [Kitasatospora sp. NPDC089913]|uniref:ricin-type beta-trefoil lectin domain protein n=1 Tax=Kitasatospora sp. NPDC089913 TaxID=3364080 RepID=UPI00380E6380